MSEIVERKSVYDGIDRDVVQAWLVHPATVLVMAEIAGNISSLEKGILEGVARAASGNEADDVVARRARASGSGLLMLRSAINLFVEAKNYVGS